MVVMMMMMMKLIWPRKLYFYITFLGRYGADTGRSGRWRLHIPLSDNFIRTLHDRLYCLEHLTQDDLAQSQSGR